MKKEDEKFYEELGAAVRKRLGITDEDAGIFTEKQKYLLMLLAEGRNLWSVQAIRKGNGWQYKFSFSKGGGGPYTVVLADTEMINLRPHIDFFSEVGMCALSPDLLHTLELDIAYDEIKQVKRTGSVRPEVFLDT